jgi:(R)-2-hydroxyacyl-CoA dehydratese activating ATPase
MCATFAEIEIVSLLAQGLPAADIASSVHRAIATRTLALVAQVGKRTPVVLTGGVARNRAAVRFLAEALNPGSPGARSPADHRCLRRGPAGHAVSRADT